MRAELGMNRNHPTVAVTIRAETVFRVRSTSSPSRRSLPPSPPAADNSRSRASSSAVVLREAIASPW
jgi:hypothetical protein